MWSFRSWKFFEKFLKFSKQNFWNFFKIEKTIILVFTLVRNHHFDQNLIKFSLKILKNSNFPLKTFIFQKFWRLRRQKYGVLGPYIYLRRLETIPNRSGPNSKKVLSNRPPSLAVPGKMKTFCIILKFSK